MKSFATILPTQITEVAYRKFTNIFLAKTLKQSIRQSFIPP